jgi:outer membrane protein TolC
MRIRKSIHGLVLALLIAAPHTPIAAEQTKTKTQHTRAHTDEAPTLALSLSDAVFLALRKNPAIRSAYVQRVAQKYDLRVAEDIFTPHASLSSSGTYGSTQGASTIDASVTPNVSILTPIGTQFNFSWDGGLTTSGSAMTKSAIASASFSQPLLQGAGLDVNLAPVKTARLTEDMNKLQLRLTISQTITSVIVAYRELTRADEQKKLADDAVVRANALVDTDLALIQAGRMAQMEITQAQAAVENQKLAVLQAVLGVEQARLNLAILLDIDLRTSFVVRDKLKPAPTSIVLAKAIEIALAHNPAYLQAKDAVLQQQLGVLVADNQRLWNVSVIGNGNIGRQWNSGGGLPSSKTTIGNGFVGLSLNAPLYNLQTDQPYIDAKSSLGSQEIQLDATRKSLEAQIRSSVISLDIAWQTVEIAQKALDYAATAISIERQKLALGKSTNIAVQTLENSYLQAESQNLSAQIFYVEALASFDLQVGTTLDTWNISLGDQ